MWWYNDVLWTCFWPLKIQNLKNFIEEEMFFVIWKRPSWIFMIIECVIMFFYGLLISCFENYMDNYKEEII
jgi:hypothetical protein